jgi:hypothetical protein
MVSFLVWPARVLALSVMSLEREEAASYAPFPFQRVGELSGLT